MYLHYKYFHIPGAPKLDDQTKTVKSALNNAAETINQYFFYELWKSEAFYKAKEALK